MYKMSHYHITERLAKIHDLSKDNFCVLVEESLHNVFAIAAIIKNLIQKNRLDYIRIMFSSYLNLNEGSTMALNHAIQYQKMDIIKYLLNIGTDPNCVSLYFIIEQNNVELLKLLLNHGLNKNLFIKTHIYTYCSDFNVEIIKIMLELEDVNVIAKELSTRWYLGNRKKLVSLLLDYGADVKYFKTYMSKSEYAEYIAKQIWMLKKVLKNADPVMLDETKLIHTLIPFMIALDIS